MCGIRSCFFLRLTDEMWDDSPSLCTTKSFMLNGTPFCLGFIQCAHPPFFSFVHMAVYSLSIAKQKTDADSIKIKSSVQCNSISRGTPTQCTSIVFLPHPSSAALAILLISLPIDSPFYGHESSTFSSSHFFPIPLQSSSLFFLP